MTSTPISDKFKMSSRILLTFHFHFISSRRNWSSWIPVNQLPASSPPQLQLRPLTTTRNVSRHLLRPKPVNYRPKNGSRTSKVNSMTRKRSCNEYSSVNTSTRNTTKGQWVRRIREELGQVYEWGDSFTRGLAGSGYWTRCNFAIEDISCRYGGCRFGVRNRLAVLVYGYNAG